MKVQFKITITHLRLLAAGALLSALSPLHAAPLAFGAPTKVLGEPVKASIEAKSKVDVMVAPELAPQQIRFSEVTVQKWESVRAAHAKGRDAKVTQIGFSRKPDELIGGTAAAQAFNAPRFTALAQKSFNTTVVAASLAIQSPGAQSMRIGIDVANLPAGVELRFRGNGPDATKAGVLGPHTAADIELMTQNGQFTYWTPITDGDTQFIEVTAPSSEIAGKLTWKLNGISHIDAALGTGFKPSLKMQLDQKNVGDVGTAGSCNFNTACVANPSTALQNAFASVTKMVFTADGLTGLCTGTLLNDRDPSTQIPYLISGNHYLAAMQRKCRRLLRRSTLTSIFAASCATAIQPLASHSSPAVQFFFTTSPATTHCCYA
jgi:hypothetical protein